MIPIPEDGQDACERTDYKPLRAARNSTTKPRTYSCDQLGICNCQGEPCTNCTPQPPSKLERAAIAALKLFTFAIAAGVLGYVWGTYEQGLTDLCWALAALKS